MVRLLSIALILPVLLVAALGSGCSSLEKEPHSIDEQELEDEFFAEENDPFEGFNRTMFRFNDALDRGLIKPVAQGYVKVLPQWFRNRFRGFFLNILEPTTVANDILQGKFLQALWDANRFAVNTIVGLGGMFDVAAEVGLPRNEEDFGQTFAVWGIGPGPYLVLPVLGPSTVRDGIGWIPQFFYLDPRISVSDNTVRWGLLAWDYLDTRSTLLGASRVLELQLDPYLFVRESYRQRRLNLIHDGNPPLESFDDN